MKKLKAEKREVKKAKRRAVSPTSGTLAGQLKRIQTAKNYRGDVKKLK